MRKIALLLALGGVLFGCEELEVHHYQVTDLTTGKVYIAETNNLPYDEPASREIRAHLFSAGCEFVLHDGTAIEIDGSYSCKQID